MISKELARAFMAAVGCENIQEGGEWLRASCPLAPWMHAKGTDRRPSFGVRPGTKPGDVPVYHCFACGSKGILPGVVHNLQWLSRQYYPEASEILSQIDFSREREEKRLPERRRIIVDKYADVEQTERFVERPPVPEEILAQFPLLTSDCDYCDYALRWLTRERKVSVQAIADFQLRVYVDTLSEQVGVVFPILSRDSSQVLDLWVRMVDEKAFFRLTAELTGSPADYKATHLWFGNHLYDPQRPGILTEGPIDVLRLYTLGPKNVMGSLGEPSNHQLENLHVYTSSINVAFDSDDAGKRYAKKTIKHLLAERKATVAYWVNWAEVGCKDAGELVSFAQLKKAFEARRAFVSMPEQVKKDRKFKADEGRRTDLARTDPFNIF